MSDNTVGMPGLPPSLRTDGPIAKDFEAAYAIKRQSRDRVNEIAKLVNPAYWWREHDTDHDLSLGQVRQTVGMFGLASIRGTILDSTWPIGENPYRFDVCCNKEYPPELIEKANQYLERQAFRLWEASKSARANQRAFAAGRGFLASMSIAIDYSLIHGDVCVWGQKDMLFEVMRPEQWVAIRDGQGNELRLILRRKIDPATMPSDSVIAADLPEGWLKKPMLQRMVWVYTDYKWEPNAARTDGKWVQTDECNARTIFTEQHDEARIFSLPWYIIPGDQYGRSFFEIVYAKLNQLDHLKGASADLVNICADLKIVVDQNSTIRNASLVGPSGAIIRGGNVRDGRVNDIGAISVEKHRDLNEVRNEARLVEQELAKGLNIELDLMPTGDRVTRYHAAEVANRLNRMTGGQTVSFEETITNKTLRCKVDIARASGSDVFEKPDDDIKPIIDKFWNVSMTAGVQAMARQQTINKLLAWSQIATQITQAQLPEDMDNTKIVMSSADDMGIDTSQWKISPQEMERRRQVLMNQQLQQATALETVKAAAPVVANRAFGPSA